MTYFASGFVDIIELIAFVRHGILRKVPRILCNKMLRLDTFNSTLRLSLNDYLQSGKGWEGFYRYIIYNTIFVETRYSVIETKLQNAEDFPLHYIELQFVAQFRGWKETAKYFFGTKLCN